MAGFEQAVVVDVIIDPENMTVKQYELFDSIVTSLRGTPLSAANLPRNTLIIRTLHGNQSQVESLSENELALPFFSPHFCPPVKPGEAVWVFYYDADEPMGVGTRGQSTLRSSNTAQKSVAQLYERFAGDASGFRRPAIGFWMSRVSSFLQYDDINYTVHSRQYGILPHIEPENDPEDPPVGTYFFDKDDKPSVFVNGDIGSAGVIKPMDTYQAIFGGASANGAFRMEPVPRFTRRPGDLVLQGSNNALISLGTDRFGPAAIPDSENSGLPFPFASGSHQNEDASGEAVKTPDDRDALASQPPTDFFQFAGTIDIVTGRGRLDPSESPTAVTPIENDAGFEETDKFAATVEEGDPDFTNDSSRIYTSMRTNGDRNFFHNPTDLDTNLVFTNVETANSPEDFFDDDGTLISVPEDNSGAAYVVVKSDEVRIIARSSSDLKINPDSDTNVQGSIRIVKEGLPDDEEATRAAIIIHPDGTVQIDAPRIILGRHDVGKFSEGAEAGKEYADKDGVPTVPTGYVKFSRYNEQMGALHDQLTTLAIAVEDGLNELDGRTKDIRSALSTKTNAPGMGAPVPGLMATALTWNGSWSTWLGLGTDPPGMAMNVQGDSGGDDKSSMTAGGEDLKSNIPDARSEVIFGE